MPALLRSLICLLRLNPCRAHCAKARHPSQRLCELAPGECACVTSLHLSDGRNDRLHEMGLTIGTRLRVVRLAPLGDPMQIHLRGYHLSLRMEEARGIGIRLER